MTLLSRFNVPAAMSDERRIYGAQVTGNFSTLPPFSHLFIHPSIPHHPSSSSSSPVMTVCHWVTSSHRCLTQWEVVSSVTEQETRRETELLQLVFSLNLFFFLLKWPARLCCRVDWFTNHDRVKQRLLVKCFPPWTDDVCSAEVASWGQFRKCFTSKNRSTQSLLSFYTVWLI